MTAVGVFGGTFAPIHHGHLRLALELRERLQLDVVHVVPSGTPPHREAPVIGAQRRLDWVRLAVGQEPGLIADDREVRRDGRSYTVDTLADLRAEHPGASIVLLLGDDAANQFHQWRRWREIADLAHLVFVERPYEPPAPSPELVALLRGRRAASVAELHAKTGGPVDARHRAAARHLIDPGARIAACRSFRPRSRAAGGHRFLHHRGPEPSHTS